MLCNGEGKEVMRIIFVRHGHPDYRKDCLTELGHKQAAAAAKRLKDEGIEKIYSSSCGRAAETAEYTAKELSVDVELCDWAREIRWGSKDETPIIKDGHPWRTVEYMADKGMNLLDTDWMNKEPFCLNKVIPYVQAVAEDTDAWLRTLGYEREGKLYRVGEDTDKTIAMFSHGGSSSAMLSHIFNLPFPFVCSAISPDFTAITVVSLSNEKGMLVAPKFEIMNDARHIKGIEVENIYGI